MQVRPGAVAIGVFLVASLTPLIRAAEISTGISDTPPELRTNRRPTVDLADGFVRPPDEAKPRVYWWWLNSQVSKEGITRDLEEMQDKGIGGALLFDAGIPAGKTPLGPRFLSDEWRSLFRHALREAHRLGLEISVNLCSGWDAGGPWITPEYACRRVVTSETLVAGPVKFDGPLPLSQAAGKKDPHDIAVLAVPVKPDKTENSLPIPQITASSSQPNHPIANVADGSRSTFWVSSGWKAGDGPSADKPESILCVFPELVELSFVVVNGRANFGPRNVEVQLSEDGRVFESVANWACKNTDSPQTIRFPKAKARQLRLLITSAFSFGSTESPWNVQVRELSFRQPFDEIIDFPIKAARSPGVYEPFGASFVSPMERTPGKRSKRDVETPVTSVINLTDKIDADGHLHWNVPAGRWALVRLTHTSAGYHTHASSGEEAAGLEVDWLSAPAMDFHFAATAGKLLEDAGDLAGTTLRYFHDDSWEVGVPNWTPGFGAAFRRRRGYDPTPYLPVLTGRIIGSPEISERFLYDYRRTLADCLADDHYRRFAELCHRRGVLLHSESGGPCTRMTPMDALKNLGRNDIPMGEFWQDGRWCLEGQNYVGKQTASAAHIYGKRFVAAEAFTSIGPHWAEGPDDMKPVADKAFCEGINRFFHHTFTCSPPKFGKPGIEYFAGTHFNPNVTWWPEAGAFERYLARCQFLLSQGLFVADVCYYYGDQAPNFVTPKHTDPSLGPGYDFDVTNSDVLLHRMNVAGGRIVLPDGMSYQLLVLPASRSMPVEVVGKLVELAEAGATIVGPRPVRAPGLSNFPDCDTQLRQLADRLWGDCDGHKVQEHRCGQGRVVWGRRLRDILAGDGIGPDFTYGDPDGETKLDYIHRQVESAEIYFVVNTRDRCEETNCSFRVSLRQPEIWDPVTGQMQIARAFRQVEGRTIVPLKLAPFGSTFVIFRKPIAAETTGAKRTNWTTYDESSPVKGPWIVRFDPKWGGPESVTFDELVDWTERPEPGIRHYSGAATYHVTFDLPVTMRGAGRHITLDLGLVKKVARVRINGRDLGTVWTSPWQIDVTDAMRPAGNLLEITVTNLWPNRLIGDQGLEPDRRFTRTNVASLGQGIPITKDSPLLPSGLLGPVRLLGSQ